MTRPARPTQPPPCVRACVRACVRVCVCVCVCCAGRQLSWDWQLGSVGGASLQASRRPDAGRGRPWVSLPAAMYVRPARAAARRLQGGPAHAAQLLVRAEKHAPQAHPAVGPRGPAKAHARSPVPARRRVQLLLGLAGGNLPGTLKVPQLCVLRMRGSQRASRVHPAVGPFRRQDQAGAGRGAWPALPSARQACLGLRGCWQSASAQAPPPGAPAPARSVRTHARCQRARHRACMCTAAQLAGARSVRARAPQHHRRRVVAVSCARTSPGLLTAAPTHLPHPAPSGGAWCCCVRPHEKNRDTHTTAASAATWPRPPRQRGATTVSCPALPRACVASCCVALLGARR
jgi:hypothetical protein